MTTVTIAEDVLLLAYREDTGKPLVSTTVVDVALGGALLAELALNRRVDLEDRRVVTRDPTPLGDRELDAALARIAEERKERKPAWWVYRLRSGGLRGRLLTRLAERGALSAESAKILGIFPTTRYPERDAAFERATRQRVESVLAGADPDERVAVLIAILHAAKIDKKVFPGAAKERVREVTEGDWAGQAVAATIASINAAVMAGVTAAIAGGAAGSSG